MNTPAQGLVVPVRLEALLVAEADRNDAHFSQPQADFARLPKVGASSGSVYLSQSVLTAPFTGATLAPGIYLQWQLPRALRSVTTDAEGTSTLPAAPDRWLVVRAVTDRATGAVVTRAWVVESNFIDDAPTYSRTSVPRPTGQTSGNTWQYMGRVYDYADWAVNGGKGTYRSPLTAVGYGVLDFSAFYPNCANVFGMYDGTLLTGFDLSTHSLSYTVVGWYANPADDPLAQTPISGKDNPFGWRFDDHDGAVTPAYTLMLGCEYALQWNPALPGGYFPDAGDPAAVNVSLGNTAPEALSALVAWLVRDQQLPEVERLLNAVQIGMLQELGQPGGNARFEAALYGAEFAAFQGGTAWDVQPRKGQLPAPIGIAATELLAELVEAQRTADAIAREGATLQLQLFADWTKFMVIQHLGQAGLPPLAEVYAFLQDEVDALGLLAQQLTTAENEVARLKGEVETAIPDTQELASMPAARFHRPADPVLLLAGRDVPAPPPDNAASILCVLTGDLPGEVGFPAELVPGSVACTLSAAWIPGFGDPAALPHGSIDAAWRAAVLLDFDAVPQLVALLAANGPASNPASLDAGLTRDALAAAQAQWLAAAAPGDGITFDGPAPQGDVMMRAWRIPWNPVSLSWSFDFRPLISVGEGGRPEYPADVVLRELAFDRHTFDYEYPQGTTFSDRLQQYQGVALLSSGAAADLRSQIEQFLRYQDDPELRQILEALRGMPSVAQAMGGFHDALEMLQLVMQLPVYDPAAISRTYATFSNGVVAQMVGVQNQHTPQTNFPYNPLRAGQAALRTLVITDGFGRWKTVNVQNLRVSETIPVAAGSGPEPLLHLPPRVAQGARLDFRWLAAGGGHESTGHAEDTPICGWVVPNHLDGSLAFYDADGVAIGTLFGGGDADPLYWMDAPGGDTAGQDIDLAFADADPVLRGFALGTYANGAAYVRDLIRTFDRTQTWVVPDAYQQDASTSVLIGTPMALVQTSLRLSLLGLPSPDQSYAALREDMGSGTPLARTTRGFPSIRFPAFLGSLSELNDGLYGFFLPDAEDDGGYAFSDFYAEGAEPGAARIHAPLPSTVTLAADDDEPLRLAMLIDPRAVVHAYTGIVPVEAIGLPAAMYAAAVARLRFTFLTAPVVWTTDGVALPLPAGSGGTWSWTERASGAPGWVDSPVGTLSQKATLADATAVDEGWLVLSPEQSS